MNFNSLNAVNTYLLDQTAAIAKVPDDAATDTERETVISSLKCSRVVEMTQDQKERAGMGSLFQICEVTTAVPSVTIDEGFRFIQGTVDYKIRKITPIPNAPTTAVYHMILEGER